LLHLWKPKARGAAIKAVEAAVVVAAEVSRRLAAEVVVNQVAGIAAVEHPAGVEVVAE